MLFNIALTYEADIFSVPPLGHYVFWTKICWKFPVSIKLLWELCQGDACCRHSGNLFLSPVNPSSLSFSASKSESRGRYHGRHPPVGYCLFSSVYFLSTLASSNTVLPCSVVTLSVLIIPSVDCHFCKMACGLISRRQKGNIDPYFVLCRWAEWQMNSDHSGTDFERWNVYVRWRSHSRIELYSFLSKYILLTEISTMFLSAASICHDCCNWIHTLLNHIKIITLLFCDND